MISDDDNNPVLYDLDVPNGFANADANTATRCDTGLIHNGGFETGNFTDWVIDGTESLSASHQRSSAQRQTSPHSWAATHRAAILRLRERAKRGQLVLSTVRAGACWRYAKLLALGL